MPSNKQSPSNTSPHTCEFELWNRETKSLAPCAKPATITVDDMFFCEEHYVDAIMQWQGTTGEPLPESLEKLIRKE